MTSVPTPTPTPTPPSQSPFKSKSGWRRILKAASYSVAGLRAAYHHEHAFRQEVWLAVPLIAIAEIVSVDRACRALMIGSVLLVLIIELLNSAIEAVVDRVSVEFHPLAQRAKDLGSAAVFIGLINVMTIWGWALLG
jgi:diacylglycerol kinase (ATP)